MYPLDTEHEWLNYTLCLPFGEYDKRKKNFERLIEFMFVIICVLFLPIEHRQIEGLVQDNVQTDTQAKQRYCTMGHFTNFTRPPLQHF